MLNTNESTTVAKTQIFFSYKRALIQTGTKPYSDNRPSSRGSLQAFGIRMGCSSFCIFIRRLHEGVPLPMQSYNLTKTKKPLGHSEFCKDEQSRTCIWHYAVANRSPQTRIWTACDFLSVLSFQRRKPIKMQGSENRNKHYPFIN